MENDVVGSRSDVPCFSPSSTTSSDPDQNEIYTILTPWKPSKKTVEVNEEEPLIDKTEALPAKSKKLDRLKKKQEKKLKKSTLKSETTSFLELPTELLEEILGYLRPSDVIRLQRLNRATHEYILRNEQGIARDIIRRRYWTLSRSFHLPVPFSQVDPIAQASLLTPEWQERRKIHGSAEKPFQHIQPMPTYKICSCLTCSLSWNNLNLILDLAHFQRHLSNREPIPMIPRGTHPAWNTALTTHNATLVERAIFSRPLYYALILQTHLSTIIATLTRTIRVGKKSFFPSPTNRLYRLSAADTQRETDEFLQRSGPPSHTFLYHRDNYYNVEVYVPNRVWSREKGEWMYARPGRAAHEMDVAMIIKYFPPPSVSLPEATGGVDFEDFRKRDEARKGV